MSETLAPQETVLDFTALDARCLGNTALVDRVLMKFTRQLEDDLTKLEQAVHKQDAMLAAELAHRIRGTAGSVEARRLCQNASQAEKYALEGSLMELISCLDRLQCDRSDLFELIGRRNRDAALQVVQQ